MRKRGDESTDGRKLEGRYANCIEIGHNAFEFLLDFGQSYSNGEGTLFHTRIITSPIYARAFCEALRENVKKHEETFGIIQGD